MILDITDEEREVLYEALMEHAADLARKVGGAKMPPYRAQLAADKALTLGIVAKLRPAH